jgi:hypothetical protein
MATDLPQDAVELEFWQRRRANCAWQTAAVIATNLTSTLSALNVCRERQEAKAALGGSLGEEQLAAVGHPHNTQLRRRWLLSVPARLARGGRRPGLRLASGMFPKEEFWAVHHQILHLAPPGRPPDPFRRPATWATWVPTRPRRPLSTLFRGHRPQNPICGHRPSPRPCPIAAAAAFLGPHAGSLPAHPPVQARPLPEAGCRRGGGGPSGDCVAGRRRSSRFPVLGPVGGSQAL